MRNNKQIDTIFSPLIINKKPLFIFELANNHMGDVEHGIRIIRDIAKVAKKYPFTYAFKFQFRDIDTFIHPHYKGKADHKYVKRFTETRLNELHVRRLKKELDQLGMLSVATPFDEASVDLIEQLDIDIIKIASCSFGDWPLLERIVKSNRNIIASTAGSDLSMIDRVVNFFRNRGKKFALLHCVGEYPTQADHLEINQIDLLRARYEGVPIGFSTHEEPDNFISIGVALAKGARIFEKHVAVKTDKYEINAYSATPEQVDHWLAAAQLAYSMCGVTGQRAKFSDKEMADLRQFKRGVFVKRAITKGERLRINDLYYAFPNVDGQLVANDISKYIYYTAKKAIAKNGPVMKEALGIQDTREKIYAIVKSVHSLIKKSGIAVPQTIDMEISHHYGLSKFSKYGMCMFTVVNREYCKKLLIMLPGQSHPSQYHKKKEETFNILYGSFVVILDGKKHVYKPGDVIVVERGVRHIFGTKTGGILEEISSTHIKDDSYYEDKKIMENKDRKTYISFWVI